MPERLWAQALSGEHLGVTIEFPYGESTIVGRLDGIAHTASMRDRVDVDVLCKPDDGYGTRFAIAAGTFLTIRRGDA